jgi:hypothetical protein
MRRYRARKRGSDVRPITYRPLPAVTKPVSWAVTKPREAERAREATRKAIDLAHSLIG